MNDRVLHNVNDVSFSVLQSLTPLHTFGLAANCFQFTTVNSLESLLALQERLQKKPFILLGEGSNTIFTRDYDGLVVKNELKGVHISEDEDNYHLHVASGENWHDLVCFCLSKEIYGFENLALIPGTVGASPIQNIGAYGVEIERFVHSVEFLDVKSGRMSHFTNKECEFAYRESRFKLESDALRIITAVNFVLPKRNKLIATYGPLAELDNPTPQSIFEKVVETRKSKLPDPKILGNAGSFFKNPNITIVEFQSLQSAYPDMPFYRAPEGKLKIPAAWLIDKLGFKGYKQGDIACHQNQALVLVNHGHGTGEDLLILAREIRDKVLETFAIKLENEVRLMGRAAQIEL
jgi:UDP-N-acetylmuramate dehydrogenase